MKLKKYLGESLHDAMNRAKMDLGEEITILESRELDDKSLSSNGKKLIEIVVSVDETKIKTQPQTKTRFDNTPKQQDYFTKYLESAVGTKTETPNSKVEDEVRILREELSRLNSSLRRMITSDFSGHFAKIYEKLIQIGIAQSDVEGLIRHAYIRLEGIRNLEYNMVMESIKPELMAPVGKNSYLKKTEKKIIVIVGPTGVGKSTSIMKLASHPSIFGGKSLGIISTDTYRMAASEPLRVFSKVANVPVLESKSPAELDKCLKEFSDMDVVLIDTPGRSPFFPNYIQELQEYISIDERMDVLLTLSVTNDLEDLYLATGVYSVLRPMGVILTKIDETARPGKIYSMLKNLGLPALFISDGQGIPKDIYPADDVNYWKIITDSMK